MVSGCCCCCYGLNALQMPQHDGSSPSLSVSRTPDDSLHGVLRQGSATNSNTMQCNAMQSLLLLLLYL